MAVIWVPEETTMETCLAQIDAKAFLLSLYPAIGQLIVSVVIAERQAKPGSTICVYGYTVYQSP
jgi:hypothetical protein